MKIRKVTTGDEKKLAKLIKNLELYDDFISEKNKKFRAFSNLDEAAKKASERYISQPSYTCFVAEEKNLLVGFIAGEIKEKKYRIYNKEGYVELWFVEPKYQGNKIGKELLDALADEFKKANCTHINLDTHIENENAIKIYEKMGFTKRLITLFKPLQNLP